MSNTEENLKELSDFIGVDVGSLTHYLRGEKGDTGEKGEIGLQGIHGVDGLDGKDGKDGARGDRGLSGVDGEDGIDGIDGKNGKDGKDGKDAIITDELIEQITHEVSSTVEKKAPPQVGWGAHPLVVQQSGTTKVKVARRINFKGDGVPTITQQPDGTTDISFPSASGTPATTVTDETTYGVAKAVGTSTDYARADHTHGTMATPTKTTVGLGNVDNTSDANKPVSTAQQTALDLKANTSSFANGVYTPTRSAEVNMDENVSMSEAQYLRVGSTVTVSGQFTANPTLTATATSFEMTLPVASNIGAVEDVSGVAVCGAIASMSAAIAGVVANDTAKVSWVATDPNSNTWSYTFSFQII